MSCLKNTQSSLNAVSVLEKLVKPLLKSKESVKCVDCDGETRFVRDAVLLLNQLDIEHPVGQYIVSVCNGFLKQYKTGGDDLLFFVCQWTKAAALLCDMGVPSCTVIKLLRGVVDECLEYVGYQTIDIAALKTNKSKQKVDTHSSAVDRGDKGQDESIVRFTDDVEEDDLSIGIRFEFVSEIRHSETNVEGTNTRLNQRLKIEIDKQGGAVSDDDFIDVILEHNTKGEGCEKNTGRLDIENQPKNNDFQEVNFHHIESENINVHETEGNCNQTQTFTQTTSTGSSKITSKMLAANSESVGESSLPVITLKMKNLQNDEGKDDNDDDDDDFSWFFEETQTVQPCQSEGKNVCVNLETSEHSAQLKESSNLEHQPQDSYVAKGLVNGCSHNMSDQTKGLNYVLNNLGIMNMDEKDGTHNNDDFISKDCDSELIRDIGDLKKNIETDLEILKKWSRRNGIKRPSGQCIETRKTIDYNIEVHDEFDDIWNEIDSGRDDPSNKKSNLQENECDKFVTVEFSWNKRFGDKELDIGSDFKNKEELKSDKPESQEPEQKDLSFDCNHRYQNESQLKSIQTEALRVESLLKSRGKNRNLGKTSCNILNNSRHFRTFQSVNSQLTQRKYTNSVSDYRCHTERLKEIRTCVRDYQTNSPINSISEQIQDPEPNGGEISRGNASAKGTINIQEQALLASFKKEASYEKIKGLGHDKSIKDSLSTVTGLNEVLQNLTLKSQTAMSITNSVVMSAKPTISQTLAFRSRHFNCDNDKDNELNNTHVEFPNIESETNNSNIDNLTKEMTGEHKVENFLSNTLNYQEVTQKQENESLELGEIIRGLLYGADEDLVDIISEIVTKLETRENLSMLNKLVDCYTVNGLKKRPRLASGLILKTSLSSVTDLQYLYGKHCRILLMNADISPTYKHKGYKAMNVSTSYTVDSYYAHLQKSDRWTQQVTSVLQKLSVDVILARGRVSDEMFSLCNNLNIVAMEMVPYRQLKLISDITETDMETYIQLVTEDSVCDGIQINQLSEDFMDKNVFSSGSLCEVVLTLPNINPQTVVLFEMTPDLCDLREQEFWDCLRPLASCLHSGLVLHGNTRTEQNCVDFLQTRRDESLQMYRKSEDVNHHCLPLVYEIIRDSFKEYTDVFNCSMEKLDCVYDDYSSKTAAWKVACDTVCNILNLEYYIITGMTTESGVAEKALIL